jgi:hypothetical protein
MSYTEFLRSKLAGQQKVTSVRKPTDASCYTQKTRMAASRTFFADGTSVGTLTKQTDRPVYNNASVSSRKASGKVPCASDFTSYAGSWASRADIIAQNNGFAKKNILCVTVSPNPNSWNYPSASSFTSIKSACPAQRGEPLSSNVQFVDDTIRLSAMVPELVNGCCQPEFLVANHQNKLSHQIDLDNQRYAVGKHFFLAKPPQPQGPNVSDHKVGGWIGPRPGYVENKHGYTGNTRPIPEAPGGQGQTIAQLKINKPTLFRLK